MSLLIKNIKLLCGVQDPGIQLLKGKEMNRLPSIKNAWIFCKDETITAFGSMKDFDHRYKRKADEIIDATDQLVLPTWCDCHTHLVYAGNRESEFVDRINGLSYEAIALKGGGILNSAKKLAKASEDELLESAIERLNEVIAHGTGAIEIKSGYGLSTESELKMLRVIKRLSVISPIPVRSTFLGAHAFPTKYKDNHKGYIDLIINEMLPAVAKENLAEYADVFCERNYFSEEETVEILTAAKKYNLIPKVHANQLSKSGGVQAGIKTGAISVDHLEFVGKEEIKLLHNSATMPVMLPGAAFFLGLPYPPAREMIQTGLPVAIASDYNPGSSPSGNMNFMVSLACIHMKMSPEQAIIAATLNSAYAMHLASEVGSITLGNRGNFIITKNVPSYAYIPYSFANNHIDKVIINGKIHQPVTY